MRAQEPERAKHIHTTGNEDLDRIPGSTREGNTGRLRAKQRSETRTPSRQSVTPCDGPGHENGNDARDPSASQPTYSGRLCGYIVLGHRRGLLSAPPLQQSTAMAAFTVKATYRSETRKFSFSDPFFPSYDELYSQVSTCTSPRVRMYDLPQPCSCIGFSPYPTPSIYQSFYSPRILHRLLVS